MSANVSLAYSKAQRSGATTGRDPEQGERLLREPTSKPGAWAELRGALARGRSDSRKSSP